MTAVSEGLLNGWIYSGVACVAKIQRLGRQLIVLRMDPAAKDHRSGLNSWNRSHAK